MATMSYQEFLRAFNYEDSRVNRAKYTDFKKAAKDETPTVDKVEPEVKTSDVTDLKAAEAAIKPSVEAQQLAAASEMDAADVNAYATGADAAVPPTPEESAASKEKALSFLPQGGRRPSPVANLPAEEKEPMVDAITSAGIDPLKDENREEIDLSAYDTEPEPEPEVDVRKGFWDELYNNREGLGAAGISMYNYGSEKASEEDLEKLIAQNPMWFEEYKKSGSISLPNAKPEEEEIVPEEEIVQEEKEIIDEKITPEEIIKEGSKDPVIENEQDAVITEAVPQDWKNADGSINWEFIGQVAKETGKSVMGLFESAIMGYLAAKQGRALGQEETSTGRNRIREEQERLMAEQEKQNIASDERQFDIARKLSEIGAAQDQVARKFQVERDEADKLFEVDRDEAAHASRMEEIAAQEKAATQRLWAAASIQKAQNDAARKLEDPLSVRDSEISIDS